MKFTTLTLLIAAVVTLKGVESGTTPFFASSDSPAELNINDNRLPLPAANDKQAPVEAVKPIEPAKVETAAKQEPEKADVAKAVDEKKPKEGAEKKHKGGAGKKHKASAEKKPKESAEKKSDGSSSGKSQGDKGPETNEGFFTKIGKKVGAWFSGKAKPVSNEAKAEPKQPTKEM